MKKRAVQNIVVKAVNREGAGGFDVVLLFSGRPETVMQHRHNGLLYQLLKDGMRFDDLRRWRVHSAWDMCANVPKTHRQRMEHAVTRLLRNLDDYLSARTALGADASTLATS